jgi:hypothetical protein
MKRDQEVTNRSCRNIPMWASIHKCMEAMLGIYPCSYPCVKLAKVVCLIISYVFCSTKLEKKRVQQVLPESRGVAVGVWGFGGELVHCIHM